MKIENIILKALILCVTPFAFADSQQVSPSNFSITLSQKNGDLESSRDTNGVFASTQIAQDAINNAILNPNDWKSGFKDLAQNSDLTLEDKVLIAAQLGGQFAEKYNVDRTADGVGIVSIEDLFASLAEGAPGGICRDISRAQGQILTALGVPKDKIFILAYTTPGAAHAVLAVQDENAPNKVTKINYKYVTEATSGSEGSLLSMEGGRQIDTGLQFRVYNLSGDPIAIVPSEVHSVLRDVFDSRFKNHVATNYNLNKTNFKTPIGETLIFSSETANGDKLEGIGQKLSFAVAGDVKIKLAFGFYERSNSRNHYDLDQDALYITFDSTTNLIDQHITDSTHVRANFAFVTELHYGKNIITNRENGEEKSASSHEINMYYVVDGKVSHEFTKDFKAALEAGVVTYVDFADVTEAHSGGITLALNNVFVNGNFNADFDDFAVDGELGLVAAHIGNTARFEIGATHKKSGIRTFVGALGRLNNDAAAFVPDSSRVLYIGVDNRLAIDSQTQGRAYLSRNLDTDKDSASLEFKILLNP